MVNKYSDEENKMVITLRNKGFVGQRLTDRFRDVYPDRSHKSVLSKVMSLRLKGVIR